MLDTQNSRQYSPDPPQHMTIGSVLASIADDPEIPKRRKADICSAVKTLCRGLYLQIESTPADPRLFAEKLATTSPATFDMSKGRFQNCRSLLDAALAYADKQLLRRRSRTPLHPAYEQLLSQATSRWQAIRLRVLFRYATERQIPPAGINDDVVAALGEALKRSTVKKPHYVERDTRRAWNLLVEALPSLGLKTVRILRFAERYVLPASDFPASLWEDLEAYLASRAEKGANDVADLLTEDELFPDFNGIAPASIRPSTANLVRYRIRQFATALVLDDVAKAETLTSLRQLVSPATVNAGLKFFVRRAKGKARSSQTYGISTDLLMIAQHWVRLPEGDLAKLRLLSGKVRPQPDGLPASARRSLAPLKDIANVRAFLALPDRIVRKAEREKVVDRALANRVTAALWIKIAQRAPLRISNLLSTRLDTNVVRSTGKSGAVALLYPADQVKNKKVLEVPLPKSTVALLDLYLAKYRPALVDGPNPYLFPAPNGRKRSGVMSALIQRVMREQLGFAINPHSFRHVAAKLFLSIHPGDYERVQLLLGHKSRETTVRYYCGLEAEDAFRHFDAMLLGLQNEEGRKP